jgi:hypothetical protein
MSSTTIESTSTELTAVTFIDGLFFDNLRPVGDRGGYKQSYQSVDASDGPTNVRHGIGQGGDGDQWPMLGEWVQKSAAKSDTPFEDGVSGYVYCRGTRPVDRELMTEFEQASRADDMEPRDILRNMLRWRRSRALSIWTDRRGRSDGRVASCRLCLRRRNRRGQLFVNRGTPIGDEPAPVREWLFHRRNRHPSI